ncbi:hypothetical protein [Tumebacillus permanentifrigoris]|uniref:Uncharacterized protein n=1 Tax=Tumebacillus permanentifrigoris TaxID=378543 RepID=A0A316DC78_9BACL|nr:hypothetical protein [Tumebacillus permanentifrigoris]PWK14897.1 hypothetical protein C7459_10499 [Tumebacillus permanentifrigoris]
MTKGEKQSFKDFTNQKQLRETDDPNYPVQHLSGDASTDNRQYITEPKENTMALEAIQANSGMFMHPMHDVTQTDHINGDKVLEQLQTDLDKLEQGFEVDEDRHDPNERQDS